MWSLTFWYLRVFFTPRSRNLKDFILLKKLENDEDSRFLAQFKIAATVKIVFSLSYFTCLFHKSELFLSLNSWRNKVFARPLSSHIKMNVRDEWIVLLSEYFWQKKNYTDSMIYIIQSTYLKKNSSQIDFLISSNKSVLWKI